MLKRIGRWFKVYEDEVGLFLGALFLLFLIRSGDMIFNNYAETTFLKRFGVEYLPVIYMVNAIAIFFIMGLMTGLLSRWPGARLLTYLLALCGATVAGTRFLIPLGLDLIYPLLFVMKALYEAILGLLFWNLANDLFNTRQSKRLFPLISAGGVLGDILGGFATPLLSRWMMIDNLMLVYLVVMVLGAFVVRSIGVANPTLLLVEKGSGQKKKRRSSLREELRNTIPLMKESALVKILVLMTFFPNVIIPIMNYLFNFAVNERFATEGGLVAFFGYFRGSMNIISLLILLFVGRVYGRWGLPMALMFHPANYFFVFLGFLLRFDLLTAMYARMSTNILRTTMHKPASDILMGLIPPSYRAMLRPFLRGTVVRIALLLGSGIILATGSLFHPRYLGAVALPFVAGWLWTIWMLKRKYSEILLELISRDQLDLKSMEAQDIGQMFADRQIRERLTAEFAASKNKSALWFARLLKTVGADRFDPLLVDRLERHDIHVRAALIDMVSGSRNPAVLEKLYRLVDAPETEVARAALDVLSGLAPGQKMPLGLEKFVSVPCPHIRGYAAASLFRGDPEKWFGKILSWLDDSDPVTVRAGIIAAGRTGDQRFVDPLRTQVQDARCKGFRAEVIDSLKRLDSQKDGALFLSFLSSPEKEVRLAALKAVEVTGDEELAKTISLLGDAEEEIRTLAREKIENAPYHDTAMLVEALSTPRRLAREAIFDILERLNIRDLDTYRYARKEAEASYRQLAAANRIKRLDPSPVRDLLADHFNQARRLKMENTLRVLAATDRSGQMKIISRGIFSSDPGRRANGVEALEEKMDRRLSRILIPLLEPSASAEVLAAGRRFFDLDGSPAPDDRFLSELVSTRDWVTTVLTLDMVRTMGLRFENEEQVRLRLCRSENRAVREAADKELAMEKGTSISDKILLLKEIEIFEGLSVSELAAVASVTEEVNHPAGEVVIREGDPGETMYLIIEGEVSVIKGFGSDTPLELDRIRSGDYFGEMALFEDIQRTASVRTEAPTRLLVLDKQEFKEIVREYPQIALEICKVLGSRLRKLHDKIRTCV